MIEPDHQAIMVKADSTSTMPSVTFHLLQDGKDLSNIMLSNDVGHAPISAHPSPCELIIRFNFGYNCFS